MVFEDSSRTSQREPVADVELDEPRPQQVPPVVSHKPFVNGYPSASAFIASDPDQSFAIYPAFHRLSTRNLLYLEAELFELQKQQDDLDVVDLRDAKIDPDILQNFRSWKMMNTSSEARQIKRVELIQRIRAVLKEYHEALTLRQTVLKMGKPQPGTIEALKLWLDGRSEGRDGRIETSFSGLMANRLNDTNDLVALHPEFERDWLARLVDIPYLRWFCLDSHVDDSIALYSMRKINRAVVILSMIIAVILLLVSIITLYFVTNNNTRLGLICGFTILFALSIHLLTNARRAELFASTAAYAAVLVVFVSGNLGATTVAGAGA